VNLNKKFFSFRKLGIVLCLVLAITAGVIWHQVHSTVKPLTRAAVDVGSGSMKVTLAKVDPQSNKIHKIIYSKEHPIPLKRDLQVGKKSEFSEKIQETAIATLASLQNELACHRVDEWKGIATAASREALNAQQMYDKIDQELGVNISIISQGEEGRLGFITAAAVSGIDPENLISLDSGSGSFQLTSLINNDLEVVEGQLGHIPSLEILMKLRGQPLDLQTPPKTVTLEEATVLVEQMTPLMPQMSEEFAQKVHNPSSTVVGIGNENFIFAMGAQAVGKNTYTKAELWEGIKKHAGLPPEQMGEYTKPHEAVLGMVLLYSIMDAMDINELTYAYANGSCEGLLVDAHYWGSVNETVQS
jgi:exopolyphosphatase/guanosine-5'-triphosphate,3'-diphosphate pyrophosphatase